ncbi:beta-lactamase-like protein [Podospora australis]|uniref:Beta-lactamase-like protein n=1 Tax=Podospora australis TaxID=1536484 RepID=A0AAN7AHG1_9PEZI|nr:beta-lactamase-like protein [Podospora australis]
MVAKMSSILNVIFTLASIVTQSNAINGKPCPPLGAVLPAPKQPSRDVIVAEAVKALKAKFDTITSALNDSAISIGVQSIWEDAPMVNLHFTPPVKNENGTKEVNIDTIYRIGSASKVFTVLSVLQQSISFEDRVTKYLPELSRNQKNGSDIEAVRWEEVTVGSLASHVSGIGRDMAFDIAVNPGMDSEWQKYGLPAADPKTRPKCAGILGSKACTGEDLLRNFVNRRPQFAPYTKPLYSNVGISLLELVVQNATGQTLDQLMKKNIFDPLNMKGTSLSTKPKRDSDAFIPKGEVFYTPSLGVFDSSGGMYSSTADMLKFGKAILRNQLGLSPAQTRKWLSPTAFTSSRGQAMGAPWEIQLADRIAPNGRLIPVYAKAGDLGSYHAMFALVPDYDLVISVMTGGPQITQFGIQTRLTSQVLRAIVPALDAVTKKEAEAKFVGLYTDDKSNSTIKLTIDDGPGLVIANWTIKGVDVIDNFNRYTSTYNPQSPRTNYRLTGTPRLYPSNLEAGNKKAWRMYFDQVDDAQGKLYDEEVVFDDGRCVNWGSMDRFTHDYLSLEEFYFTTGGDGRVQSLRPVAFELTLGKK